MKTIVFIKILNITLLLSGCLNGLIEKKDTYPIIVENKVREYKREIDHATRDARRVSHDLRYLINYNLQKKESFSQMRESELKQYTKKLIDERKPTEKRLESILEKIEKETTLDEKIKVVLIEYIHLQLIGLVASEDYATAIDTLLDEENNYTSIKTEKEMRADLERKMQQVTNLNEEIRREFLYYESERPLDESDILEEECLLC